jgi:hypothetical protein
MSLRYRRRARVSARDAEPRPEDSKGQAPSRASARPAAASFAGLRALLGLTAIGGSVLLIVAEFTAIYEIKAVTAVVDSVTGYDRHGIALALLGVAALPMLVGAVRRGSRPATVALAALGAIALLIAVVADVPDIHQTGVVGEQYDQAVANAAIGLYLETLGGALLVVAGGGLMVLGGPPPARAFHTARRRRS